MPIASALAAGARYLLTFNVRDYHPSSQEIIVLHPGALIERLRSLISLYGK